MNKKRSKTILQAVHSTQELNYLHDSTQIVLREFINYAQLVSATPSFDHTNITFNFRHLTL